MNSGDPLMFEVTALVETLAPGAVASALRRLTGGVSASTFLLEAKGVGGQTMRWVVQHRAASDGSLTTAAEYALLNALHTAGVPVPQPHLLYAPEVMVRAYIEGTTELPAHAPQMAAAALARIHATRADLLPELPDREDPAPVLQEELSRVGLEPLIAMLRTAATERCVLHGDFWPGNLLWRAGDLIAILDWEDAATGDPLSDLACARVELEVAAGRAAADRFTQCYLSQTGRDPAHLPLWDVYASTTALQSMDSWGLAVDALQARRAATVDFRDRAIRSLRRGR